MSNGWRKGFGEWWNKNRVEAHKVKNMGGFAAKIWKAALHMTKSTHALKMAAVEAQRDELLEALKVAKWMLERDYIDDPKMQVIERCDAAIAKVEGRS